MFSLVIKSSDTKIIRSRILSILSAWSVKPSKCVRDSDILNNGSLDVEVVLRDVPVDVPYSLGKTV